jgi:hypothetical protein
MTDATAEIAKLLQDAQRAHGAYETEVLGGAYDEEWPAWYASYLLDHGLRDRLPGVRLDAASLAETLRRLDRLYKREQPGEAWLDFYARRLISDAE